MSAVVHVHGQAPHDTPKNADVDVPDPYRTFAAISQGALRVAAISGPVVSPAPNGEEALALWDHVAGLACSSNPTS